MTIALEDLARLLEMFQSSDWNELHFESAGVQIFLSKDPNATLGGSAAKTMTNQGPENIAVLAPASVPVAHPSHAAPSASLTIPAPETDQIADSWVPVVAPNLGTFYRSPKPGSAPFVEVGQEVSPQTEVCLIEVMKLFTTVNAGVSGIIRKVCADDSELVEGGQVLFYVERV